MFRLVNGGEFLPQRATIFSAGFDVFANEDMVIGAGETKLIGLGIALDGEYMNKFNDSLLTNSGIGDWEEKHYLGLHIRSSLRAKGLTSLGTGIIDMDYRNEIKMVIHNPYQTETVDLAIRTMLIANNLSQNGASDKVISDEMLKFVKERKSDLNEYKIQRGDKIAQLILCKHEGFLLPAEYTLNTERNGGFGSTDAH